MTRRGTARTSLPLISPQKPQPKTMKKQQTCRSPKINQQPSKSVYTMTSRDFQRDTNAHVEVIAEHLKDFCCINFFQAAIMHNKHLFRGRKVLDIGCGVGILSLFAAKAGAAHVYAVDSSNVVDYTEQIVSDNGYADIIHVIKGSMEDIVLPVDEVDIIICNWLGYSMLFQAACDMVIYARDKWLNKENGIILPDVAKLFMAAIENTKHKNERVEWWNDVYGVNMKCVRNFALSEPCFQLVKPKQLMSTQFGVKYLNMYTATKKDLKFRCKYMLEMQRSGNMDGIVTYFHVYFSKSHTPMGLSTDPSVWRTHWMQTVFFFDKPVYAKAGELYYGGIEMCSVGNDCDLNNMELSLEMFSGDPAHLHLEAEMRWKLKPHAAIINERILEKSETSGKNKIAKDKKQINTDKSKTLLAPKKSVCVPKEPTTKTVVVKSATIVPTIGNYSYPCNVTRRNKKAKNSKKR
ncbi:PREDICTED: protein arginine N-methyltransferase 1-like [Bactrocera latifrons]|uniref:protein arginine N-methyltransferase 1-like n=1 Tax=Bactrocera latifrons TaxID=174628 RepID=UPI0008DE416F|nr:PREDICTED: protein arginine N-methyltransferase 1-like [Bactrocera latifrons]